MSNLTTPYGRRLSPAEATALGYIDLAIRDDDGTVQSMALPDGYRVTYSAPSYRSAVAAAAALTSNTGGSND